MAALVLASTSQSQKVPGQLQLSAKQAKQLMSHFSQTLHVPVKPRHSL